MQFFVLFMPKKEFATKGVPADFQEVELQEQEQTRALYGKGSLREVWAVEPKGQGAAVLFEADSPEHLEEIIHTFPLIKVDYADYQVSQLAPHPAFIKQS